VLVLALLQTDPDNADAWTVLAQLGTSKDETLKAVQEILRIRPGDPWAQIQLAKLTGKPAPMPSSPLPAAAPPPAPAAPGKASPAAGPSNLRSNVVHGCLALLMIVVLTGVFVIAGRMLGLGAAPASEGPTAAPGETEDAGTEAPTPTGAGDDEPTIDSARSSEDQPTETEPASGQPTSTQQATASATQTATLTETPTLAISLTPTDYPTPTDPPDPDNVPTSLPPPAPTCDCFSGDRLNCSDFVNQAQAQACYDLCLNETGRDVHRLDANDDDLACN
jgi:hypothetical protein